MPNDNDSPDCSAKQLTIAVCNCQARILLDLAHECYFDYEANLDEFEDLARGYGASKLCRQHAEDLRRATTILQGIIAKLNAALDRDQTSTRSLR
jgi:hypothetical protein